MTQKTSIEMARQAIAKVTRAEVRLKHSLLADLELNEVLTERLADFDIQLQAGIVPYVALKLVTGDADAG